ncbi:hypothetical protein Acor_75220 [Acrocarpospora corrugata]|uniref:Uncharacterized protein n=1 Tax=Acrocarpospora corrugata TaxID=35763 RepID=A0A5M3W9A6_9ACTN|nr:hypothetical protein [Acrocarpospora corrugata]GES05454.1 hypothetical protein Acor_75220 [Acrocarpospora corrugata]
MPDISPEGIWNLVIATPIGEQRAVLELFLRDGVLCGVARDQRHGEEVTLADLTLDGDRLTWAQSIRKPIRLNLTFDVTVSVDELTGRSKAGRLPSSKVTGHRATPDAGA